MIDWGFDLPVELDDLGDHISSFDLDHDGIPEMSGGVLDVDHDGIPESSGGVIDLDHDGIPEMSGGVLDVDHDGIPESSGGVIDLDHDRIPEGTTSADAVDPFLRMDHFSVGGSAVTTTVASLELPDPFA